MKQIEQVTQQQFAKALIRFVGHRTGCLFMPYKIVKISFVPPEIMDVSLHPEPTNDPVEEGPGDYDSFNGIRFSFSKEEVAHALSKMIGLQYGLQYEGNLIPDLPSSIPGEVTFELAYIPEDSSSQEGQSLFEPLQ